MLRGYDLVTLVAVVPGLVWLLVRRTVGFSWFVPGLCAYVVYTYVLAAVTGGLGVAFLIDVAVASAAAATLIVSVAVLPRASLAMRAPGPSRAAAALLALLAAGLAGMWVTAVVSAALGGQPPAGSTLVESELVVRVGIFLDLSVLVPTYTLASVLLWRGSSWGVPLGLIAVSSGLLHQASYVVALLFQAAAEVPGAHPFDPFEPAIIATYLIALGFLLHIRNRSSGRSPGSQPTAPEQASVEPRV